MNVVLDSGAALVVAAMEQSRADDVDPERLRALAARLAPTDPWAALAVAREELRKAAVADPAKDQLAAVGLADVALRLQRDRDLSRRHNVGAGEVED